MRISIINNINEYVDAWEKDELKEFLDRLEEMKEDILKRYEIPFSNHVHFYAMNMYGDLFNLHIHLKDNYTGVHIWDVSGGIRIYHHTGEISKDIWEEAEKRLDMYSLGFMYCTGCGKKIKLDDISSTTYAAVFCLNNKECEEAHKEAQKEFTTF